MATNEQAVLKLFAALQVAANGYIEAKSDISNIGRRNELLQQAANTLNEYLASKGLGGFKIEASAGIGKFAHVPWVGIFSPNITTKASEGHYPVLLYGADMRLIFLSYSVANGEGKITKQSREQKAELAEKLRSELSSLESCGFGSKLGLNSPGNRAKGYENGSIYSKSYQLDNLRESSLAEDLVAISALYSKIASATHSTGSLPQAEHRQDDLDFMNYEQRLICALAAKPFVILAGGTGTGKTKSAIETVKKLCRPSADGKKSDQFEVIAVGADWTDTRPLLGYVNLLIENGPAYSPTAALQLILRAHKNPSLPHFLVLDEMNLSHVERYFSDFLSLMEAKNTDRSAAAIRLHSRTGGMKMVEGAAEPVPAEIPWPANLHVVGTVNIDETTHMFSPKVLDRAHVIEFKVTWGEIESGLERPAGGDVATLTPPQVDEFMRVAGLRDKTLSDEDHNALVEVLEDMHEALDGTRFVFAHRTARECLNFIASAQVLAKASIIEPQDTSALIDLAILQKALPKLNGSAGTLSTVLDALIKVADKHDLELSKRKLKAMQAQLKADQFVSFIQ